MSLLKTIVRARSPGGGLAPVADLPAPERPVCVVGDIHGRADLLVRLLDRIAAEAAEAIVVCVGDYIDRGPASAAVLRRLRAETRARPAGFVCLLGNHEEMMLDFLDRPAEAGPRWLRNGGLETLGSFGLRPGEFPAPDRLPPLRDALRLALGPDVERWLRTLPLYWRSGGLVVAHADADPALPMEEQDRATLLWGRRRGPARRADGLWLAHGHTITATPAAAGGRVAVDTGAYATGVLTAALIEPGNLRFLRT